MSLTIWDDIKQQFRQGDTILRLIMVNVSLFLLVNLIFVPFFLAGYTQYQFDSFMQNWFYLPSDMLHLLYRPWTLFTYMFLHDGFMHILFNMLIMYWFGRMLINLLPNHKVLPLYLLGGMVGGLLFVIAYNISPALNGYPPILGASAGVMAIVLATATLQPRASMTLFIIGRVELQYIALFLVLFDIILIPGNNAGGRIAHLGGALMGWFYIFQLQRGNDLSKPFNRVLQFFSRIFRRKATMTASSSNKTRRQPRMEAKFNTNEFEKPTAEAEPISDNNYSNYSRSFAQTYRNLSQEECINAILDKIRRSGYHSLTEDEKAFLDKTSKDGK